ncbi:hypothetical protein BDN72DRAFT_836396 [Pluteus cervinus]|uniref:Uncharacterized protein n=1 Tax=Pluteus cervinus TaxID=181527 RepID=A0ACD3B2V2_9AGAR|nr:hypothetical protein BDN72DRAFT_836396 [Pluteus cervinus]
MNWTVTLDFVNNTPLYTLYPLTPTSTVAWYGECTEEPAVLYADGDGHAGEFGAKPLSMAGCTGMVAYTGLPDGSLVVLLVSQPVWDNNTTKVAFMSRGTPINLKTIQEIYHSNDYGPTATYELIDGQGLATLTLSSNTEQGKNITATFTLDIDRL